MGFQYQSYNQKPFRITDTLQRKKVPFSPAEPGKVLFYTCGPTVYGPLHIGNARSLYVPDVMTRWLRHIGYEVNYVRNYTDVDDKIITRANEEKVSAQEIAQRYTDYCEEDLKQLGLQAPSRTVNVTESMDDIIKTIELLIQRGIAYVEAGEVFYAIEKFATYGKLSGKKTDDLLSGVRISVSENKRNPLDFSLWKPAKPGEPHWASPWGEGRPGWHIECSAMVLRWLGETIDLHHGGQDLIFPHHENEIAQSEGATQKTFSRHWVHTGFLTVNGEKMSKSLGNVLDIRVFLESYGAEILKYLFLKHHYRAAFDFNDQALDEVLHELERIYLAQAWAIGVVERAGTAEASIAGADAFQGLEGRAQKILSCIEDELFNDFNTPGVLGQLFVYIRELNHAQNSAKELTASTVKVAQEFLALFREELSKLLGVFAEDVTDFMARVASIRATRSQKSGVGVPTSEEIEAFIEERKLARVNKNFARSDEIRKELDARGVILMDSPQGTTWKYK